MSEARTVPCVELVNDDFQGRVEKRRQACRGILIRDGKILLSYARKWDKYRFPGGGMEAGETLRECCRRELLEETGILCWVGMAVADIVEKYDTMEHTQHYFVCEMEEDTGRTHLTAGEARDDTAFLWMPLGEALALFGAYEQYRETDIARYGLYRREFAALKAFTEGLPGDLPLLRQTRSDWTGRVEKIRQTCRGIVVRDGKVLLSYMTNADRYLTPGGGLEGDETFEDCCRREVLEETGLEVRPLRPYLEIEYFFLSNRYRYRYFICEEIRDTGMLSLTPDEQEENTVAVWMDLDEALAMYGSYPLYEKTDVVKHGMYRREYTALKAYADAMKA